MTDRKSVAICVYLFDVLVIESQRLSDDEFFALEAALSNHSPTARPLAAMLTAYLKEQRNAKKR